MKAFYSFFFLSMFLTAQQEVFKLTYNHQALPVQNLEETGDFYVNILGFEEMEVGANQTPPKRWVRNYEGKELHLIIPK